MGRPKGGKNRDWTVEMKMEVINYYFSGHSRSDTKKKFNINSNSFIEKMIKDYSSGGIAAIIASTATIADKTIFFLLSCASLNKFTILSSFATLV